jgi:hypothetical protein
VAAIRRYGVLSIDAAVTSQLRKSSRISVSLACSQAFLQAKSVAPKLAQRAKADPNQLSFRRRLFRRSAS